MWNEKVTLYIDDTSLRLMVTQGQRVKKWADMHLEPGLVKDSMVINEAEVGARLKNLIKSQRIRTKKVILGVSGLHSLTRPANLPQLPKSMLVEAVSREARRVLPVPLDQLYLAWTIIPGPKSRISVYLAATPRKSIDSIMRTLKIGGLEASRMSIKPLALTKAIPTNSAILVDLQPTEFDIAIMVDGVSQPVRSVSLPSEELSWEQKIKMIVSDLDRTIRFFATNNPEKPLDIKVPIYVSGELTGKPIYQKVLEEATGRSTMAIVPAFKGLEQFDPGRYMVNITMVLSSASAGRELTFPVANLNMLPIPYQPKPISMIKVAGIPASVAVTGIVIPMVMMMQSTSVNINVMQEQLQTANQIINQKSVQKLQIKKEITELEKKSAGAKIVVTNLNSSLNAITNGQEIINGDLLLSLSKLSATIELRSIRETANRLEISGFAPTDSDIQNYAKTILTYARDLDISKRFSQSLISSISIVTPVRSDKGTDQQTEIPKQIEFNLVFTREK
jgi:type IV pilus assembly protein PilM